METQIQIPMKIKVTKIQIFFLSDPLKSFQIKIQIEDSQLEVI